MGPVGAPQTPPCSGQTAPEGARSSDAVAALEGVMAIIQRDDQVVREAANGRRTSIATVLGFNGVLIGLSIFAVGDVASEGGVMASSPLLPLFSWFAGFAILFLGLSALLLLVALAMDAYELLEPEARRTLDRAAGEIGAGEAVEPTIGLVEGIQVLAGDGRIIDSQRRGARRQRNVIRAGLALVAVGFFLLSTAGILVVSEVL